MRADRMRADRTRAQTRVWRRAFVPYLLILPGGMWLAIFLVVPIATMLSMSLMTGNLVDGFQQTLHWRTYTDGIGSYSEQYLRSLWYGLATTVVAITLAFPMAYWIAFRGGSRKSTYLLLMLLPFFVSSVIRTVSWKFILTDDGIVLGNLKDWGVLPGGFHVLATDVAVIGGLTYQFLPFMVLPIYVALERIDERLVEAAYDLYASRVQAFTKVIFPLALPGVFAGVLMTFVPASADFVNSTVLGGADNTMIGNVIHNQFVGTDYPVGAALSFTLMAILLVGIFGYARSLGTEDVMQAAAR